MKRNRRKFNPKASQSPRLAGGNILTLEQRRLVEKQQEMLRNISLNQGMASYPAQEIQTQSPFNPISSLLSSLGSLPATGLLPSLLTANTILPLMSSPAMVPPPSIPPLSNPQGQSSLFGPGPSNSSFFDGVHSQFRSRDLGEQQSKGIKNNNRTWEKPKPLMSSQDSKFNQPFSSSSSFEEQSWIMKNNNSNKGLNWASSNVELQRDRPTHTQSQNSFPKPWNKDVVQAERPRPEKQNEGSKEVSRDKFWTDNSWNDKSFHSDQGFNERRGGQMANENSSAGEESRWAKNSGEHVWGKRLRDSPEKSWRDSDLKTDYFHGENSTKRLKTSDNSWTNNQNEHRGESWGKKSNVYAGKSLSSKYVEPERNWPSSLKEQEENWSNRDIWQNKQQMNDEGNSWRAKALDPIDKSVHAKSPVNSWSEKATDFSGYSRRPTSSDRNWSDKSLSRDQERLSSNVGNKSKMDKNNQRDLGYADKFNRGVEESLTRSKDNEENLSKKDFWKGKNNESKEKPWVPPNNFLYPDPVKAPASGVWSRLNSEGSLNVGAKSMREEGNGEHRENILMQSKNKFGQDSGFDSLKTVPLMDSLEDPNLQLKIRYLDNQLGQLDERMLQIHSLTSMPGKELPVIWDNQNALTPPADNVNTIADNDLRALLKSKAKDATKVDSSKSNTGGWTDTMVLVYPFLKSTMSLADILDLKSQLSEQIHSLLDDNSQDIQPRFYGTAMVCKNWFMVHCADQQSVDWLFTWKPLVKAKTRMKLCMRKAIDAVQVTHVSIVLKGIKESIRDIEIRLINQNQHLEPHMWRRGPHTFSQNDTTVSFHIDAACLKLLEANSWEVYYEMTKFKVRIVEKKPIIPLAYTTQYLNPI